MRRMIDRRAGFSLVVIVLVVVVIAALAGTGLWLYQRHVSNVSNIATNSTGASGQQNVPVDPYAGWKTYCDSTVQACIKYPRDWVTSRYSGWEDPKCTAYALLSGPTVKDGGSASVYIASINDLSTPNPDLKVLGMVINNEPIYSIYNASYLSQNDIRVGANQDIAYINYRFTGKTGDAGLIGTPCANGAAAITTFAQARAWFNSTEGQTVLKVVQSFSIQ